MLGANSAQCMVHLNGLKTKIMAGYLYHIRDFFPVRHMHNLDFATLMAWHHNVLGGQIMNLASLCDVKYM